MNLQALTVVGSKRSNRERLRSAISARDAAQLAVSEARATLERLEAVINASDGAAKEAARAAYKMHDARQRWIQSGCTYSSAVDLQALEDAAAAAARVAQRATLDAEAVSKAIARATDTVKDREVEVRECEAEVSAAIGVALVEEASPVLERLERLAQEYRSARFELNSLLALIEPSRFDNARVASEEGARAIIDALIRAKIQPWDDERSDARSAEFVRTGSRSAGDPALEAATDKWRERAARVRRDSDAN